jgi:rRNA pseudouridine-1189 N-methylase Emg1 (Nep1/Mra1 family)
VIDDRLEALEAIHIEFRYTETKIIMWKYGKKMPFPKVGVKIKVAVRVGGCGHENTHLTVSDFPDRGIAGE